MTQSEATIQSGRADDQYLDLPIVVVVGPTAVGKTALSLSLAEKFSCEIVGADSMQVYRHMDIGTAKPNPAERGMIPHHLIDVADPREDYQAARYAAEAFQACLKIIDRGKVPMVVGGTGLYVRALIQGVFNMPPVEEAIRANLRKRLVREGRAALYGELEKVDPVTAARIHVNDTQRLLRALEIFSATNKPWSRHLSEQARHHRLTKVLQIGLNREREILYKQINQRVKVMMDVGLLEEVRGLLGMGYSGQLKSMQSLGYRHMVNIIEGHWSLDEAVAFLARDTRRYAKRQMTWFGQDKSIHWFAPDRGKDCITLIDDFLNH